jgi:hypothetical protein
MTPRKKTLTFCKYCGGEHTRALPGVSFDYTLEDELDCLDQAIEPYLEFPTAKVRDELRPMVERLVRLIDNIDRAEDGLFESGTLDVDLRPSAVYRLQVALVRATKAEFIDQSHDTLTALHSVKYDLILARADRLDDPPPLS